MKMHISSGELAPLPDLFKAMGHASRLQILTMLRGGEICVCHIKAALGRRQAYVSQQLRVLRDTGAVVSRREGSQVYYRLADPRIETLLAAAGAPLPAPLALLAHCANPSCAAVAAERS